MKPQPLYTPGLFTYCVETISPDPTVRVRVEIPENYSHDRQLSNHRNRWFEEFKTDLVAHPRMTDKNCSGTTDRLKPGRAYVFSLHKVLGKTSYKDSLMFLEHNGSLLVGPQGLTLLHLAKPNIFYVEIVIAAMDKPGALMKIDGMEQISLAGYSPPLDKAWNFCFSPHTALLDKFFHILVCHEEK